MLLTLVPVLHSRLEPFGKPIGPTWFQVTGHAVTVLVGLALLALADQLARQKRRAWQISVCLYGVGTVSNLLKGPHPVSAGYCLLMLVVLLWTRRVFRAAADPPSLLRLLRLGPLYALAVLVFGYTSLYLEHDQLSPSISPWGALRTILGGLVGVSGPYTYHRHFFDQFFPTALLVLGVTGVVGLVVLLFRPLRARRPHTEADWEHARRLVRTYGSDTLAYFALRDDKSFFYSADGEAMIAYTYIGGYALVSGDPVGAPASVPEVLDEFLLLCTERAWNVAFLAVREADAAMYAARGLRTFYLGDEAIIRCDTFSLDGHDMKGVRSATRRVGKRYRFQLLAESTASPQLVSALNAISARWRGKNPERGFTMSLSQDIIGNGENPEFLLCVALDAEGVPAAFLRIVPAYGRKMGYTLDLMRHDPDAPNGMTEFLIAQTALALGARGVDRLSMNFAMWGRLFEPDIHYGPAQRIAKRVVTALNPFFQIQSLHDFNAKFSPVWLPRSLVYRDVADLPRVGLLYAGAEGFLAVPGIGGLLVPKPVGGVPSPAPAPAAAASRPAA